MKLLIFLPLWTSIQSFVFPPRAFIPRQLRLRRLHVSRGTAHDEDDLPDDATLLQDVPISQFVDLCLHLNLTTEGTKEDLLARLRIYAEEQAALDKQRKLDRAERVQQGVGEASKERYELVSDEEEVESSADDEGFFYFTLPTSATNITNDGGEETDQRSSASSTKTTKQKRAMPNMITAPPPPIERNEEGERVVTIYSTSDTNDLTGNIRPGDGGGVLMEGKGSEPPEPWQLGASQGSKVPVDLEESRETVMELVRSLLLLSGAPAFVQEFTEGLQPLENTRLPSTVQPSRSFVGFLPSMVPTDLLMASSKSLRAGRGSVLQDVLHELEMRAIGHDGMTGDDKSKGGGHYLQVNKVRAFLEGFQQAELRRIARETTTLLLDKLASEGIQGLDNLLATMVKSQDDSGDVGELSDALLDFLNDMVRQQSTRVGDVSKVDRTFPIEGGEDRIDQFAELWNVTDEKGERIETLNPNDPAVKAAMAAEWNRNEADIQQPPAMLLPTSASERLLLLLKMLRDRIKAEAAFGSSSHGRNLRTLAYCLRFDRALDREKLLRREFQPSVDRLDEFLELVTSSMEYAESASTQLKAASSSYLNRKLLGEIFAMGRKIRDETVIMPRD
jgi:hypothetical protein